VAVVGSENLIWADWLHIVAWGVVFSLTSRRDVALENIALRQQLMVLQATALWS